MEVTPGRVIGGLATVGAAAAIVLWGVPSYIKVQVRDQVAVELAQTDFGAAKASADANTAAVGAMQTQLTGMEQRMIQRDEFVMNYFREQAERAERARSGQ